LALSTTPQERKAWWEALAWEIFLPCSRRDTSPCACTNSVGRA